MNYSRPSDERWSICWGDAAWNQRARVGDYNQSVTLDAVRREPGGLSQVDLIALTELSKQTVSGITRRLVEDGCFRPLGVAGLMVATGECGVLASVYDASLVVFGGLLTQLSAYQLPV